MCYYENIEGLFVVNFILSLFTALFIAAFALTPVFAQVNDNRERINRANQQPRAAIPDHLQSRAPAARSQMAPGVPQQAYREEQPRGFFDWLFGNKPAAPVQQQAPSSTPTFVDGEGTGGSNVGGRRTICVRTCDGAFMPISTGRSSQRDSELCSAQCPGAETKVFALNGDRLEDAVTKGGESYSSLPNALKFREGVVQGCSCRPTGKTWAEYAANKDDPTMKKGDSVLTPEQAKKLSFAPEPKKPTNKNDINKNNDNANYILKPAPETVAIVEEVVPQTGEVRVIQYNNNQKSEENPIFLTPLQKLIQKHNEGKADETASIDKKG